MQLLIIIVKIKIDFFLQQLSNIKALSLHCIDRVRKIVFSFAGHFVRRTMSPSPDILRFRRTFHVRWKKKKTFRSISFRRTFDILLHNSLIPYCSQVKTIQHHLIFWSSIFRPINVKSYFLSSPDHMCLIFYSVIRSNIETGKAVHQQHAKQKGLVNSSLYNNFRQTFPESLADFAYST